MEHLLAESLEQGALGFSSTISNTHNDAEGQPVPSRHASREELLALAGVVRGYPGTTLEFLPGVPPFSAQQKELMVELSLAAQRPLNWNVLAANKALESEIEDVLQTTDLARSRGAEVLALTVPQPVSARLNLYSGFVFDALAGWAELFRLPVDERMERLRDPAFRKQLDERASSETSSALRGLMRWERMRVSEVFSPENEPLRGRTIGEIAQQRGAEPFDVFLDVALADGLRTQFVPMTIGDDAETWELRGRLWRDDRTVIGASDAGAHLDLIDTFAQTTQVLGNGVRKHGVIGLEAAVHQLTQVPADLYGLRERGVLREGWCADVVVFDPSTVAPGPTYTRFDLPAGAGRLYADAIGVEAVFVNGVQIMRGGEYTGATPGTVLRSGRDTRTVEIPAARRQ
jgi:N-acyl-D-aspartate/D-glutamate deacylase